MSIMRRVAVLGLALAMFTAGDTPGIVRAQTGAKVLIMGSLGESDTFIGGEENLYGTAVVGT